VIDKAFQSFAEGDGTGDAGKHVDTNTTETMMTENVNTDDQAMEGEHLKLIS